MYNLNNYDKFFEYMSNNDVRLNSCRRADRSAIMVTLVAQIDIPEYKIVRDGHKAVLDEFANLRDKVLSSDLFSGERKALEEYKKLSDMKFVLDALKELDLSSIKEQKQEPEYIDISLMLGGKSDKKR